MTFGRNSPIHCTCGLVFCILFLLTELKSFSKGQYYRRLSTGAPQKSYKRQPNRNNLVKLKGMIDNLSKFTNKITEQTNMVKDSLKQTYSSLNSQPRIKQFPLALPLGESVNRDKIHQTRNKTIKNITLRSVDVEKDQRWRFKLIAGTNRHLKEIFIGKCWHYQNIFKLLRKRVECNDLWDAFVAGFAYKQPCDTTLEDYQYFFSMIEEEPLVNKSLLWSGSRDITHELSFFNSRFTALEDTFAGYLLDGMQWCGMTADPGINYEHCPYECAKQKAFWGAAAKKMAERSEGIVYAVLNGTRQHWHDKQIFSAYMMDSYMSRNQVPNLDPRKVKEVRIMVGHSLHQKVLERCGTYSLKELQKQLNSKGIKTSCVDDPLSLRALLCLDYPRDALCQFHLTTLISER